MISLTVLGLEFSSILGGGSLDLARGAIAGAIVVGAAFLAGFAVLRRGSAAACALLMVVAAGGLEFAALGFFPSPPSAIIVLLQGVFAASAIIFLSSAIRSARNNAILGGVMFAAALTLLGLGVLNIALHSDLSGLMRAGLVGVGALAVILSAYEAIRGDTGAQLILPGALIAAAGPAAATLLGGEAFPLLSHALFTFGVLTASLVSLAEGITPRITGWPLQPGAAGRDFIEKHDDTPSTPDAPTQSELLRVSENQLAQVLDYSGVAVWDWTRGDAHQTRSFGKLMGAAGEEVFTPEALRSFIHKSDIARFESKILDQNEGDGGFDIALKLHNGEPVRMRGARAIDKAGGLERLVVLLERTRESKRSINRPQSANKDPALALAAGAAAVPTLKPKRRAENNKQEAIAKGGKSTERRANVGGDRRTAKTSLPELTAQVTVALNKDRLEAAFQPIVDLKNDQIVGYEALVRWPDGVEEAPNAGPEDIVRAAQAAGKGRDLVRMMLTAAASFMAKKLKSKQDRPLFVALNVSVTQLLEESFIDDVRKAISSNKLPGGALVLELTEAEQITDAAKCAAVFAKLKKTGAALAFDDFGAGFSSLSNLQKFSFDYLKIDKSFIGELTDNDKKDDGGASKIVASVAGLGRDLGMKVIAEGIENSEAANIARSMGCHFGQGFLFGEAKLEGAGGADRRPAKGALIERKTHSNSRGRPAEEKPERKRGWSSLWSKGLR